MPELPEVQSIVNALLPHLPSHTITPVSQSRLVIAPTPHAPGSISNDQPSRDNTKYDPKLP